LAIGVARRLLSDIDAAPVLQVISDAGGPERVATDVGRDATVSCTPLNHSVNVGPGHSLAGELAGLPGRCPEEGTFAIGPDGGGVQVFVEVILKLVMARHLVELAVLLL
jgi:hypothetical protein